MAAKEEREHHSYRREGRPFWWEAQVLQKHRQHDPALSRTNLALRESERRYDRKEGGREYYR